MTTQTDFGENCVLTSDDKDLERENSSFLLVKEPTTKGGSRSKDAYLE
jgi:hypothetical protein